MIDFKDFEENDKVLIESAAFAIYEINNSSKNDLFMLSKLLDEQSLVNLISYYGGTQIKVPTREEYNESSLLALYFFFVDIKGLTFSQATDILKKSGCTLTEPPNILGKKLAQVRQKLAIKLSQIVQEIQEHEWQ